MLTYSELANLKWICKTQMTCESRISKGNMKFGVSLMLYSENSLDNYAFIYNNK